MNAELAALLRGLDQRRDVLRSAVQRDEMAVPDGMLITCAQYDLLREALRERAVRAEAKEEPYAFGGWSVYVGAVRVATFRMLNHPAGSPKNQSEAFARSLNAALAGVTAWGCTREANGRTKCYAWCGNRDECPATAPLPAPSSD